MIVQSPFLRAHGRRAVATEESRVCARTSLPRSTMVWIIYQLNIDTQYNSYAPFPDLAA